MEGNDLLEAMKSAVLRRVGTTRQELDALLDRSAGWMGQYMLLGMFMDGLSMLLLTLPIIYPIIVDLGFSLVWFGVIATLLVEMALISPPVGMNIYVVTGITKVPMMRVFKGAAPFFAMMLVGIILMWVFPQIVTFLPGLVSG